VRGCSTGETAKTGYVAVMNTYKVFQQASQIAERAKIRTEQADLELSVQTLEYSSNPSLQSIARVYRMLQRPFSC
jgi:DNA-binding phage protein